MNRYLRIPPEVLQELENSAEDKDNAENVDQEEENDEALDNTAETVIPACRFFCPSRNDFKEFDGLAEPQEFDYTEPLVVASCSNPAIRTGRLYAECAFTVDQRECPVFALEPWRIMREATVDQQRLRLKTRRIGGGSVAYIVTLEAADVDQTDPEHDQVLTLVNATLDPEAAQQIDQTFDEHCRAHQAFLQERNETTPPSYLDAVL